MSSAQLSGRQRLPARSAGSRRGLVPRVATHSRTVARAAPEQLMPMLPFPREEKSSFEMLLPGMTQDLHLYEPRYMTMIDRLMAGSAELAHVVVDEAGSPTAAASDGFDYGGAAFCYAVVVKILDVRDLSVGKVVRVQGMYRANVQAVNVDEEYLQGVVGQRCDTAVSTSEGLSELAAKEAEYQRVFQDVSSLFDRMAPSPERAAARRAFRWIQAEEPAELSDKERATFRAERASWASFVGPPKTTSMEADEIRERSLTAMQTRETLPRLQSAIHWLEQLRAGLSARAALSALGQPSSKDSGQDSTA